MGRSYFVRKTLYSRGFSPRKTDDKFLEKDDIKTEDKESEVKYLPLPDPMPLDAAGNRIDSRIPEHLKPPEKLSSLDFLVITIFILPLHPTKVFTLNRIRNQDHLCRHCWASTCPTGGTFADNGDKRPLRMKVVMLEAPAFWKIS